MSDMFSESQKTQEQVPLQNVLGPLQLHFHGPLAVPAVVPGLIVDAWPAQSKW